jgi:hypothetical protein
MLSLGCGSSPAAPGQPGEPLSIVRLGTDAASFTYYSGLKETQRVIVRDRATWQAVWSSIWKMQSPEPPLPDIDFTREMVVVAALGERPTGGYGIFVDAASEGPSGVTVRVRSISPSGACMTTQALTQPVDIARMPRRSGPVAFEERAETTCR